MRDPVAIIVLALFAAIGLGLIDRLVVWLEGLR